MAHFAKIEDDSTVSQVIVVDDKNCKNDDAIGQNFINNVLGLKGTWIRTAYNTSGNINSNGGKPFRKNYAGAGYSYDKYLDAFMPPQPYPSWILDKEKGIWQPPIPYPNDNKNIYHWNEDRKRWVKMKA